ncbi:hypothetical protein BDQ17DRAFT_1332482 [Cyathus striatus]|nr:hypothetical protein BDQ17DRAFT_1332482 [Cyathus striatus]
MYQEGQLLVVEANYNVHVTYGAIFIGSSLSFFEIRKQPVWDYFLPILVLFLLISKGSDLDETFGIIYRGNSDTVLVHGETINSRKPLILAYWLLLCGITLYGADLMIVYIRSGNSNPSSNGDEIKMLPDQVKNRFFAISFTRVPYYLGWNHSWNNMLPALQTSLPGVTVASTIETK